MNLYFNLKNNEFENNIALKFWFENSETKTMTFYTTGSKEYHDIFIKHIKSKYHGELDYTFIYDITAPTQIVVTRTNQNYYTDLYKHFTYDELLHEHKTLQEINNEAIITSNIQLEATTGIKLSVIKPILEAKQKEIENA